MDFTECFTLEDGVKVAHKLKRDAGSSWSINSSR